MHFGTVFFKKVLHKSNFADLLACSLVWCKKRFMNTEENTSLKHQSDLLKDT